MAKRGASTDINHDNWDAPFEPEEAGNFKAATPDVLKKRLLRVAKRSLKSTTNDSEAGKSVFAAFSGFKPMTTTTSTPATNKPFGFLGGVTSSSNNTQLTDTSQSTVTSKTGTSVTPSQQYLADLQQLNRSVSDWIKQHVDSNPLCILTPVFDDYNSHLKKIQVDRDIGEKAASQTSSTTSSTPSFNFVSSSTNDSNRFTINLPSTTSDTVNKTFKFADTSAKISTDNLSTSIFGAGSGKSPLSRDNDETKPSAPSIFSSIKGEVAGASVFTKPDPSSLMINPFISVVNKDKAETKPPFSNGSAPTSTNKDEEEDNESEEPPKVEFTQIQEEGSVFSTRCKVFVKKEGNFKDRGVGTLFIKKVGEDKHQLLVRAETVLGNVLVNVLLTAAIPTQRMGKNNVMLVCLPTPQDPPPPTTVLLRVKTADDADNLLATLDKHKQ